MGLHDTLSNKSGLTGIIQDEQLAIAEAWQVTMIDVNERGTKAAAATGNH